MLLFITHHYYTEQNKHKALCHYYALGDDSICLHCPCNYRHGNRSATTLLCDIYYYIAHTMTVVVTYLQLPAISML